jgi:hypothetical protein
MLIAPRAITSCGYRGPPSLTAVYGTFANKIPNRQIKKEG